jgi:hypothetical protein
MKSQKKNFLIISIVVILAVVGLGVLINKNAKPGKYDDFARILSERGAVFYGTFWCPHCQSQKSAFGSSRKYLPYVECSKPDGQSQTLACSDKKIESYPTWNFAEGIKLDSTADPIVCEKAGVIVENENSMCNGNLKSENGRVWVFPGYSFSIQSSIDPVFDNGVWIFPDVAVTRGSLPLEFLARQVDYNLEK